MSEQAPQRAESAPAKTCVHGECLDHEPELDTVVGELLPNPGFFGGLTYLLNRCCGRAMKRYAKICKRKCTKCQRIIKNSEWKLEYAVCDCCGLKVRDI